MTVTHRQILKNCKEDKLSVLQKLLQNCPRDYMRTISMFDIAIQNNAENVVIWLAGRKETTDEDLKYGIARAKFYKQRKLVSLLLSTRVYNAVLKELETLKVTIEGT